MKIICPNLKNKEVAREFEELKNATSEAAAYHIWSQNNGNGIDKAPNGEPSKLFSDLLEHYNGDRVAAIQAKARTYSKSFKEWFGESKVVDKNGEPLVVYHGTGTPNKIEEFKSKNNKIWFTDKSTAQAYANFDQDMRDEVGLDSSNNIYPVFLSIKNPKYFDNVSYTTLENFESADNDGMIATNVSDYEGSQEQIVAFNPNQIKSVDNQGTFSIQDNNIYNQKIVSRETRLENFYNSYVKLRTKTVEKAENETELRKRRSKLSSNSKLHETNLDAIMQEILGIYIYDADYSTTDSTLRELNNLSESRYLTLLNEEIDKLDRLFNSSS
jgi:ribosomal protein L16 Arg81 hydroxylase